jgi:hypothetical protein
VKPPNEFTCSSIPSINNNIDNGHHIYCISYFTKTTESEVSNYVTINSLNSIIQINNIPISNNLNVIGRKIYRSKADQIKLYLLVTINNNIDTTFNDSISDSKLGIDYNIDNNIKYNNIPTITTNITKIIVKLKEKEIIDYHSKNNDATLIFNEVREDDRTINRVSKHLENQNQLKKEQLQSVIQYISEKKVCKNKLILNYFGEKTTVDCGVCSFCITKKIKKKEVSVLSTAIITLLQAEDLNSRDIQNKTKNSPDEVIGVLQDLLENNTILVKPNNKYTLRS